MASNAHQIILVRHAETLWALNGQHTGRSDIPLTPHGESQAESLAARLARFSPMLVLSSPTQRARRTALLAGFPDPEISPDLHEWNYGDYESLTTPQILTRNPTWSLFRDGSPNGESPADILTRTHRLLSRLLPLTGTILLFSSGHFLRSLTSQYLQLPLDAAAHFSLDPASLSILSTDRSTPTLKLWNDTTP